MLNITMKFKTKVKSRYEPVVVFIFYSVFVPYRFFLNFKFQNKIIPYLLLKGTVKNF